jgi:CO/xanthine dehydrogenase FAD-binding subunit
MLNMAIWLERRDDRIEDIRISIGPAGPVPSRMRETERYLIGQSPNLNVQGKALEVLLKEAHFRTSAHRATSEYRRHLAGILLQEALTSAWERAENV